MLVWTDKWTNKGKNKTKQTNKQTKPSHPHLRVIPETAFGGSKGKNCREGPSLGALIPSHLPQSRLSLGANLWFSGPERWGFGRCQTDPAGWRSSEAPPRCDRSSQSQLSMLGSCTPVLGTPSGRLPALEPHLDHLHQQVGSV